MVQLINKLNSRWLYIGVIAALTWWILFGQASFRPPVPPKGIPVYVTDTVYVPRPAPAVKLASPPVAPKKVEIYTRPDTARRQAMESGRLITGLELRSRQLQVHTISPQGIGQISTIPIKDLPVMAIQVDSVGQVSVQVDEKEVRRQHRRKVWRKIGNGVLVLAAFAGGILL